MYAFIAGKLEDPGPPTVLDCDGVGYEIHVPERHRLRLPRTGELVRFYTHLWVREDQMTLYGFPSPAERELFRTLVGVSGVGPKVALAILGDERSETVLAGAGRGDPKALLGIKGIGRKTAERLVLELKDKLAHLGAADPAPVPGEPEAGPEREAVLALEALGLPPETARGAVAAAAAAGGSTEVADLVRGALRRATP